MSLWFPLSGRKKFVPAKSPLKLPCDDLQLWWYKEILMAFLLSFFLLEIQTESSRIHPSPERTGNFLTDESHRVSHRLLGSLCSVECPGPCYIRLKTFQTLGDADVDTDHHHPHHSSGSLQPNITQKNYVAMPESIDCLGGAWHMSSLLEGQFFLRLLKAAQLGTPVFSLSCGLCLKEILI